MKPLWTSVALLFLVIGCGGSGNSPTGAALHPPANIDVVSCSDIVASGGASVECADCCTQHGFPGISGASTYENRCICGNRRDDSGDGVCAAQNADADVCIACCTDADFTGHEYQWSSDGGGSCKCNGRRDRAVCAGPLGTSAEAVACEICCLNNGYLRWGYLGNGPQACECFEP